MWCRECGDYFITRETEDPNGMAMLGIKDESVSTLDTLNLCGHLTMLNSGGTPLIERGVMVIWNEKPC